MITIIAAIGTRNELGKDNGLIWHLPADLKRFKKVTTGSHIIMGRKTFESIGKPLPDRTTIIVTRNKLYEQKGCLVVNSIETGIEIADGPSEIFIIGGAAIYKQCIERDLVDKLDITLIHQRFDADVFFPEIDETVWKVASKQDFKADAKNKYDYSFISYMKELPEVLKGVTGN
ncbi:MAG: dihydrofolate reductase [Flavobacteriaceae bacterium]|nr:MAG: dihydrofolate reductase [Flavobacteriaceae bacterium]